MPQPITSARRLTFACMADSETAGIQALVLARSIHAFAGDLSKAPILILIPESADRIPKKIRTALEGVGVQLIAFKIDRAVLEVPFAAKVFAFAAAEGKAHGEADILVCMDSDTLVISEPKEFVLKNGKDLGYRPVHHVLIGSLYDDPIDPFWELIYQHCNVSEDALFPMITCADHQVIRPYFNAGLLVVSPERGLLQRWREVFAALHRDPVFEAFYQKSSLYRIFIHQAVLTGTILSTVIRDQMQELPELVNYPLHLHSEYYISHRPKSLNELITCRYEVPFADVDWQETIMTKEPLKAWLDEQLQETR